MSFPVVAMVCSVGGLDAVSRVVARLPSGLPAALLVLQHADPQGGGRLAPILAGRTALAVREAVDGDRLRPGLILVAPAGHHTLATAEDTVTLIPSSDRPPYRPSADLLLVTLAVAQRERVIAVILTGRGNDGATGTTAVQRFGGQVIVSDEHSSQEFAMPQAAIDSRGLVEHVLPLDDIADLLVRLSHP